MSRTREIHGNVRIMPGGSHFGKLWFVPDQMIRDRAICRQ